MPAPNSAPRFVLPENSIPLGVLSVANAARDGTGTIVDVMVGAADGSLVELIRVIATGTTTAGNVKLFIHNGSAWRFYDEIPVTAITPSATVVPFEAELVPTKPLVIPTGWKLGAAPHAAEGFNVWASGGNY